MFEIALPFKGNAFRVVYEVQLGDEIWDLHAFQKKQGIKTPKHEVDLVKDRLRRLEGDAEVKPEEKLELVRGSGNVYKDLGRKNADAKQFKAILAAEIVKVLDAECLTVRAAHARTGIAAADFSRIRNADLGRFTADRLIRVLNRLGAQVEVSVRVRPARRAA